MAGYKGAGYGFVGVYSLVAPTYADGESGGLQLDVNGNLKTTVSGSGSMQVTGNVASGAADSGNPVKIGGVFNTTLPTVTNGQRVDIQTDNRGRLITVSSTAALTSTPFKDGAVSITPVTVSATPATFKNYNFYNPSTTELVYIQILDNATGKWTLPLPPGAILDGVVADGIPCATSVKIFASTAFAGTGTPGTAIIANVTTVA